MGFLEKVQKDIKENVHEGIAIFREGSEAVSKKIGRLTEEGKKKYKIFMLNMKIQDELAKLGGKVYDLSSQSGNPMSHKRVLSIIARIRKLEEKMEVMKKRDGKRETVPSRKSRTGTGPKRRTGTSGRGKTTKKR